MLFVVEKGTYLRMTKCEADLRRRTVKLLLLSRLQRHGERCGWEMAADAEKFAAWPAAAGTVLPLLWKLQRQGLVRSRWITVAKRRRKQYQITEAGVAIYHKGIRDLELMLRELKLPEASR